MSSYPIIQPKTHHIMKRMQSPMTAPMMTESFLYLRLIFWTSLLMSGKRLAMSFSLVRMACSMKIMSSTCINN